MTYAPITQNDAQASKSKRRKTKNRHGGGLALCALIYGGVYFAHLGMPYRAAVHGKVWV